MKFISICSGIEAASVAFGPLGWKAVAFSEIEPFPCAVLAHHYPDVPNMGDMSKFREWPDELFAEADAIVGGPPCQAFSVAGLRNGLNDDRGNLTLTYAEMIDHADAIRSLHGKPPVVVLYENVPGLLSDKTGAYGCFLAALAGEAVALEPPGSRWTDAGCVFGPKRAIAWRVLDAQYFALAQRRRRVFVVASARDGFDPATVLFEWDGVRRDSPPSREAGQIPAAGTGAGAAVGFQSSQSGVRLGDTHATLDANNGSRRHNGVIHATAFGGNNTAGPIDVATARNACASASGRMDFESETFLVQSAVAFNARQDPDHWHDRTGPLDTDGGTQAVSYAIQAGALRTNPASGPDGVGVQADHAYTLEARAEVQAVATPFDTTQITSAANYSNPKPGDPCHPLAAGAHPPAVVFAQGEYRASAQETNASQTLRAVREAVGAQTFAEWGLGILDSLQRSEVLRQALHGIGIRPATFSRSWVVCCALGFPVHGSGWLLQSLREAGCERCSSQGWEPSEQLAGELGAYLSELSRPGAQAARFMRDLWLASEGFGLLQQALLAVQEVGRPASRKGQSVLRGPKGRRAETPEDVSSARVQCEASRERVLHETCAAGEARDYRNGTTEQERSGKGWVGETPLAVRRLTVEECEFLQGFPRGYSKIPWRNKPANECPDGPRYKALGNSWAVPVVRWIGERIQRAVDPT